MTRAKRLQDYREPYIWGPEVIDDTTGLPMPRTSRPYKPDELNTFVTINLLCDIAETLDRLYLLVAAKVNEKQP